MPLFRVAWRTVGSIVTRVNADIDATVDRLDGLSRIGIDEISYKRGHRYLIVVVDHDSGRLVWAGPGRNDTALNVFFDELGPKRAALLTHVSADMADWIARVVARRAPPHVTERRSVPCRRLGDRSARHRTSPRLERGQRSTTHPRARPARALDRRLATHLPSPICAVEEPRRSHPPPTPSTRLDREDRPTPVARILLKEGLAMSSRSKARKESARSTDGQAGPAAPDCPVRATPTQDRRAPPGDRRRAPRPASLKVSSNRRTPRSAYSPASHSVFMDTNHSSRSQCSTPSFRPQLTHGNNRRAAYLPSSRATWPYG